MDEKARLRKVIFRVIEENPDYASDSSVFLVEALVPAILDEFDDVFEKSWMYDQLCD